MSEASLRGALGALLGTEVAALCELAGGDVCAAWQVTLASGDRCFAKRPRRETPGMPDCEARGLAWLAEAGALRVPAVRATSESILVLEWIESGPPGDGFDEALGRGLAALHRAGAEHCGFEADNFIGPLPQSNTPGSDWAEFYARERLEPQLRRAREAGRLSAAFARRAAPLLDRLAAVAGPPEPPARLHGDLWGGNCMVDARGDPVLVDPAVYGGHREVDLAMMRLFGGFSQRVFDAYAEVAPLAEGAAERVPLYQLYPRLVHLNLFGGSYLPGVEQGFERYL